MIQGASSTVQALLGTLFTWGLTALGAAGVFFLHGVAGNNQRRILSSSLGFAAGVMLAASYWSLLAPAVELTKDSDYWKGNAVMEIIPVTFGFLFGALFVYVADRILDQLGVNSPAVALAVASQKYGSTSNSLLNGFTSSSSLSTDHSHLEAGNHYQGSDSISSHSHSEYKAATQWKRILLLIVAITVHNIPEGLAVGVGFGAIGKSPLATFESARTLCVGIGIQNFPEGLAVSLPLYSSGFSTFKAFWYGQLSGMVEPLAGVLGAVLVTLLEPVLPWALAFAAGAMIYVVISDIIPEAHQGGYEKMANWSAMIGFVVMMSLDVGLG